MYDVSGDPDVVRASTRGALANTANAAAILDLISRLFYWIILSICKIELRIKE